MEKASVGLVIPKRTETKWTAEIFWYDRSLYQSEKKLCMHVYKEWGNLTLEELQEIMI